MKIVQGSPVIVTIAVVMGLVMVVMLIWNLVLLDPTKRKLLCLIRGGHQFVPHPVQLARAVQENPVAYRTDVCTRRHCGIQREVDITKPLQEA